MFISELTPISVNLPETPSVVTRFATDGFISMLRISKLRQTFSKGYSYLQHLHNIFKYGGQYLIHYYTIVYYFILILKKKNLNIVLFVDNI